MTGRRQPPAGRDAWRGFLLALTLSACAPSCGPGRAEQSLTDRQLELARHAEAMLAAVRARDIERVRSFYDSSGGFVHYEDGREVPWSVLEPEMRQFMRSAARIDLHWNGPPVIVLLGADAALIRGTHSFEGALGDGTVLPRQLGTWTGVVRRIGGTWKLIHSHSSAPPR